MSIYAVINENEPEMFASVVGWSDIVAWAESLDAEQFPNVVHLTEHGYTEQIPQLIQEIESAIDIVAPSESVASSLNELVGLLQDESGVLLINDGMGVASERPT